MSAVITSIRLPEEVRDQYEMLAQATGRTRNDLMVDALRRQAARQIREIELIQEGLADLRAGRKALIEEVIADFIARGMLTDADRAGDPDRATTV